MTPLRLVRSSSFLTVRGKPRTRILNRRRHPKPIGWKLTDLTCCEDIKASCKIACTDPIEMESSDTWKIWCDGGTRTTLVPGRRRKRLTAGAVWGLYLFPRDCSRPCNSEEALVRAKGRLTSVLCLKEFRCLVATRYTNKTAGMTALIEVYWFLFSVHGPHPSCLRARRLFPLRSGNKVVACKRVDFSTFRRQDHYPAMGVAQGLFSQERMSSSQSCSVTCSAWFKVCLI